MANIPFVKKLLEYLKTLPTNIYTKDELSEIIRDFAKAINYPLDAHSEAFTDHLVKNGKLVELEISKPEKKKILRYAMKKPSQYDLALSFKQKSFLTHISAAYIHGLVHPEPGKIYISSEGQEYEPSSQEPGQDDIDRVFSQPQRQSVNEMVWGKYYFIFLSARNTGLLGVENKEGLSVTCVERTLIDLVIRPAYGGGAGSVLAIFKNAIAAHADVKKLIKIYNKIPVVYPYHQSLGWYLSAAGYSGTQLEKLKRMPAPLKFYVGYDIKNPLFDREWNVYYPGNI